MTLVTNVSWTCPCGSKQVAQVYGELEDYGEFDRTAVPSDRELRWNPPCSECGEYQLEDAPIIPVELPIVKTKAT